jgi:hypothetical protein
MYGKDKMKGGDKYKSAKAAAVNKAKAAVKKSPVKKGGKSC